MPPLPSDRYHRSHVTKRHLLTSPQPQTRNEHLSAPRNGKSRVPHKVRTTSTACDAYICTSILLSHLPRHTGRCMHENRAVSKGVEGYGTGCCRGFRGVGRRWGFEGWLYYERRGRGRGVINLGGEESHTRRIHPHVHLLACPSPHSK